MKTVIVNNKEVPLVELSDAEVITTISNKKTNGGRVKGLGSTRVTFLKGLRGNFIVLGYTKQIFIDFSSLLLWPCVLVKALSPYTTAL